MQIKNIINPKAHQQWLIERIRSLEETDSPVLASVANACLHYLTVEIGHSNLSDPITGAPLLKTAGYLKELEMYIHRLQRYSPNTEPCVKLVHECIIHLKKQSSVNQTGNSPCCPYCGYTTTPVTRLKAKVSGVGAYWQCYFRCSNCFATSPTVAIECETEEAAIVAAKQKAQRRNIPSEDVPVMTNEEWIKSLHKGDLANTIHAFHLGYSPWCDHHCKNNGDDGCNNCIAKWLEMPATDNGEPSPAAQEETLGTTALKSKIQCIELVERKGEKL